MLKNILNNKIKSLSKTKTNSSKKWSSSADTNEHGKLVQDRYKLYDAYDSVDTPNESFEIDGSGKGTKKDRRLSNADSDLKSEGLSENSSKGISVIVEELESQHNRGDSSLKGNLHVDHKVSSKSRTNEHQ